VSLEDALDRGAYSDADIRQLNALKARASTRGQEIIRIAESINELATMFNQLNCLIVEQGTILDRIDYSVDQSVLHVQQGVVELRKADDFSKKNKAMHCILVLAAAAVIMLIIFIYKKAG
jgi:syntaxin 16